ncbi:MAG: N-acetylneuraminate synthase family protein [Ignavibacteria bacterium]|nr:N-acetylneuraminate synthase family protein [Ignavibacteria bacterium]
MYIIAEIGQAHDGSLGIAHSFIDALKNTGVDAIKYQTHIASAESSEYEDFRVNFSYEDKSRYDYWKRMEFTFDQWQELKSHCESLGFEFLSSPFSIAAFELLEKLKVKKYKIGSGEINNYLLLDKIFETGKEVIISTGLSDNSDLQKLFSRFNKFKNNISLLHCITAYPSPPESWNLRKIIELKKLFDVKVGYSDHSGEIFSSLAAVALGAEIIEFHVTFDKKMFGPDSPASLTIQEVFTLVQGINKINTSLNYDSHIDLKSYENKIRFGKSLSVNKNLSSGHVIMINDLESKKPFGKGINPVEYKNILGKKLKNNLLENSFINYSDII